MSTHYQPVCCCGIGILLVVCHNCKQLRSSGIHPCHCLNSITRLQFLLAFCSSRLQCLLLCQNADRGKMPKAMPTKLKKSPYPTFERYSNCVRILFECRLKKMLHFLKSLFPTFSKRQDHEKGCIKSKTLDTALITLRFWPKKNSTKIAQLTIQMSYTLTVRYS